MLQQFFVTQDKNTQMNFDAVFSHLNQFYLGMHSSSEIDTFNTAELPYGAMSYDTDAHVLKVLSDQNGAKVWKSIQFA